MSQYNRNLIQGLKFRVLILNYTEEMGKTYKDINGRTIKVHTDIDEVKQELQKLADALNLSLNDQRVFEEWSESGNAFNHRVWENVLKPLYG